QGASGIVDRVWETNAEPGYIVGLARVFSLAELFEQFRAGFAMPRCIALCRQRQRMPACRLGSERRPQLNTFGKIRGSLGPLFLFAVGQAAEVPDMPSLGFQLDGLG